MIAPKMYFSMSLLVAAVFLQGLAGVMFGCGDEDVTYCTTDADCPGEATCVDSDDESAERICVVPGDDEETNDGENSDNDGTPDCEVDQDDDCEEDEYGLVINSFTATPEQVAPGYQITVSWDTSNAESCTKGGWASEQWTLSPISGGESTFAVPSGTSNGEKEMSLNCSNSSGTTNVAFASVTIQSDEDNDDSSSGPELCTGDEPPDGFSRQDNIVCDKDGSRWDCTTRETPTQHTWEEVWGLEYPSANTRRIYLRPDHYAAISFTSDDTDNFKPTATANVYDGADKAVYSTASISRCPGDFRESHAECFRSMFVVGAGFDMLPNFSNCDLEAGTDYYFNILYYDLEEDDDGGCPGDDFTLPDEKANCALTIQ